jgi:hypothetical protein
VQKRIKIKSPCIVQGCFHLSLIKKIHWRKRPRFWRKVAFHLPKLKKVHWRKRPLVPYNKTSTSTTQYQQLIQVSQTLNYL